MGWVLFVTSIYPGNGLIGWWGHGVMCMSSVLGRKAGEDGREEKRRVGEKRREEGEGERLRRWIYREGTREDGDVVWN